MPWTDKSDPPSPSTTPEAGRSDDAANAASRPEAGRQTSGRKPAGPWGEPPSTGLANRRLGQPLGSTPASPPAARPDLESLVQGLRPRMAHLSNRLGGRGLRRGVAAGALAGFVAGWALSGVYEVRPDEQAVVTRLGVVEAVAGPGLHVHRPWPFERAQTLAVTRINTLNLGDAAEDESQALTPTADDQMAEVAYAVQWRIADPIAYLFNVSDPQGALKLSAEAAMRQAVGALPLSAVMGADHAGLQRRIAATIQQRLSRLRAGITITGVLIQAVSLPPEVHAAASDVVVARQDADASLAGAEAYRARTLVEAKASAAKALVDATSYRDQTLSEAQGAAARFEHLDAAYRKAPGVTKDRLYFETLQGVLSRAHTVILDPAKGATVTLPPDLLRNAAPLPHGGPQAATRAPSQALAPSSGSATAPGDRP